MSARDTLTERANTDGLQAKAVRVQHIIGAAVACLEDPKLNGLCFTMLEAAQVMAAEINRGLDSVNQPEGGVR